MTGPEINNNTEGDQLVLLRDLSAYDLRLLMREHVLIIMGSVVAGLVAFVLPSTPWEWWLLKLVILLPAGFLGIIRFFMLNGVREELERRAARNGSRSGDTEQD